MGGICDLIARGAPPLPRTSPNFRGALMANPDAGPMLRVASDLAQSPDRAKVHAEIRAPPATPRPPPPAHFPSDQNNAQTTDAPSDYHSDWFWGLVIYELEVGGKSLPLVAKSNLAGFFYFALVLRTHARRPTFAFFCPRRM